MKHKFELFLGIVCGCLQLSAEPLSDIQNVDKEKLAATSSPIDATLNYARGHEEFRDLYFKQHEQEFVRLVREGQSPQNAIYWL